MAIKLEGGGEGLAISGGTFFCGFPKVTQTNYINFFNSLTAFCTMLKNINNYQLSTTLTDIKYNE